MIQTSSYINAVCVMLDGGWGTRNPGNNQADNRYDSKCDFTDMKQNQSSSCNKEKAKMEQTYKNLQLSENQMRNDTGRVDWSEHSLDDYRWVAVVCDKARLKENMTRNVKTKNEQITKLCKLRTGNSGWN